MEWSKRWSATTPGVLVAEPNRVVVGGRYQANFDIDGHHFARDGGPAGYLAGFDQSGQLQWGLGFGSEFVAAVDGGLLTAAWGLGPMSLPDGTIASGTLPDGGSPPNNQLTIVVGRVSGDGVWQSARQLSGGFSMLWSLAASPDESVVVAGRPAAMTDAWYLSVAKFDTDGRALWESSRGMSTGARVHVDSAGNIIVVGSCYGRIDWAGPPPWCDSMGREDLFIAKLDRDGVGLWIRSYNASHADDGQQMVSGSAIDAAGNIYLTGSLSKPSSTTAADFGGGPLEVSGSMDAFVAKFAPDGTHLWSHRYGGLGADRGLALAIAPNGDVVVGGAFDASTKLGPAVYSSVGDADLFLLRIDSRGTFLSSMAFGSIAADASSTIAFDSSGHIFSAGACGTPIDFGRGVLTGSGDGTCLVKLVP